MTICAEADGRSWQQCTRGIQGCICGFDNPHRVAHVLKVHNQFRRGEIEMDQAPSANAAGMAIDAAVAMLTSNAGHEETPVRAVAVEGTVMQRFLETRMEFKDLKQHMAHTNCFTRNTVSSAMAKMHGEPDHKQYDTEAGKLLRKAMDSGEIRFIENRERSCYYDFAVPNAKG